MQPPQQKISLIEVASNPERFVNAPLAQNILAERQSYYYLLAFQLSDWLRSKGLPAHELGDYSIINLLTRECQRRKRVHEEIE